MAESSSFNNVTRQIAREDILHIFCEVDNAYWDVVIMEAYVLN